MLALASLVAATGCQSGLLKRQNCTGVTASADTCTTSVAAPASAAVCSPPAVSAPPPAAAAPPPPVKSQAPTLQAQPQQEVFEQRSAAVTQDMLLVPRMVYMPYMPHTPTAPARMRMADVQGQTMLAQPGSQVAQQPAPVAQQPAPVAAAGPTANETRLVETLDNCNKIIEGLNHRITQLESRPPVTVTQTVPASAPAPVIPYCPPAPGIRRPLFPKLCPTYLMENCPPIPQPCP